jgi:hypothetical protein
MDWRTVLGEIMGFIILSGGAVAIWKSVKDLK